MSTYDDLVNDYLRAVENALAGVPANRRAELLADLSEHIAAKRAELAPGQETEVEVRSILELLGDPEDVAAEAMFDAEPAVEPPSPSRPSRPSRAFAPPPPPPPVVIQPRKRSAALIWVAITIAAVATMCVAAGLLAFVLFASSSSGGGGGMSGDPEATPPPPAVASPTVSPS